jgi:hypothetical protein
VRVICSPKCRGVIDTETSQETSDPAQIRTGMLALPQEVQAAPFHINKFC